jgi:hypothetical protein
MIRYEDPNEEIDMIIQDRIDSDPFENQIFEKEEGL